MKTHTLTNGHVLLYGLAIVSVIVAVGYTVAVRNVAAATITFTHVATHPQAIAEAPGSGQTLQELAAFNGKIYPGYGDYTNNIGPITINPYNPATGTFEGSKLLSPTEAIYRYRIVNGKLYAPDIDPIAGESSGGYAVGEPWSHKAPVQAAHIYDVVSLTGSDLWMVGSQGSKAAAWRSTDGGATWALVQTDDPPSGDFVRYYWAAVIGGKIYMQAESFNTWQYSPVKIFDGTTWRTGTSTAIAWEKPAPVVFNGKIIGATTSVRAFDGTNFSTVLSGGQKDIFVSGSWLYILRGNNSIVRTSDLTTFETVATAPSDASSIALLDDRIYIGAAAGKLYQSSPIGTQTPTPPPPPPADTTKPGVSLTSPTGGTISGTIALKATATDNSGVAKVEFFVGGSSVGNDSSSPYQVDWASTGKADGTYDVFARATDTSGNTADSGKVSMTIKNKTDSPAVTPTPGSTEPKPAQPAPSTPASVTPKPVTAIPEQKVAEGGDLEAGGDKPIAVTGTINVTTSDDLPSDFQIAKAEYYLNGELVATVTKPPYMYTLPTRDLQNGSYELTVKYIDVKGETIEKTQDIVVDNPRPWQQTAAIAGGAAVALGAAGFGAWRFGLVRRLLAIMHPQAVR